MNLGLINDAINGDRRSLARTLSGIENGTLNIMEIQQNADIPNRIDSGNWKSLAITGAPGVGKSCLIDKLLSIWAGSGMKIALLAIDPSSPRTGGALLGDRVRITSVDDDSLKENIYIRSIATRKSSGNVPLIVADMVEFLHMAGWERVVIETVGSGQSEVRCAAIADRIVVVEGPARGDGVQAEKAGLLELADAVIVNKSDLKGAEKHAEELLESFELGLGDVPPVMLTSALNETGISEAADALLDLPDTGRSVRARWRERLLAHYERKILESPDLEEILSLLAVGSISVDEAINTLGGQ
ncbi:MAG: methylmalonyl Co-A mutase-associated GTPase MeaB [Candidatus Poseidoniaceae archaeon]